MAVQRLRVRYGRAGDVRYIAHLDMMRMWWRIMRRAGIPLAYSGSARPKLSIAAALPVGVTSDGELLDVYLRRRLSGFYFVKQVEPQLPSGVQVHEVIDVPIDAPSLQSLVRRAEYAVTVEPPAEADVESAVREFLEAESVPWEHRREKQVRRYDLRKMVFDLWVEEPANGTAALGMTLKTDPESSGRPEQVVAALGLPSPTAIHRTRLILADPKRESKGKGRS